MPSPPRDPELTPVAELFAEFLNRREQGDPRGIDAFCAEHPERADELRRFERHWRSLDAALGSANASANPGNAAPEERYEIGEEVARGGMGVVLRAFDRNLRRKVAMKVADGCAGDLRAQSRFLDEARIAGQLEHPGIVPIYDLGTDAAMRPYFTMPLLRGRTFREVIDAVHAGDAEWTLPRALGVLLAVCDAVASAHARGVIHRDLKPSNVIVGKFGETYVVDWGLARVLSEADHKDIRLREVVAASSVVRGQRSELAAVDPESPLITMDGDVVGTPAYMPPEQARGEVHRVGPRADVYAAGAMLYHVLAGEMPYVQKGARVSAHTVLARVLDGPPRPLLEIDRQAPAELVAICSKAMAREPEARYADMRDLAADLRAFLELRVVRAYASGAWAELRKWVRRNRLAAGACAAGVLALGGGLFLSLRWKQQADAQAVRAEAGYDGALEAVDKMVMRVGAAKLVNVPGAELVRRELLQDARGLYEKFLAEHGDRPELRARVARTHKGLANLHQALGEHDEAEQQGLAAIAAYDHLVAERPDDPDVLCERAACWQSMAILHGDRGRPAEAEAELQRARQQVDAALARHQDHLPLLELRIAVGRALAHHVYLHGRSGEALELLPAVVRLAEAMVARTGGARQARLDLARLCQSLGSALAESKRPAEAAKPLQQAIDAFSALLVETPRDAEVRAGLAKAWMGMEYVHRFEQRPEDALAAIAHTIELYRELAAEFPRMPDYHHMTGSALSNRALVLNNMGRATEALVDLEEAIRLQKIAMATVPDHTMYRRSLTNHLMNRLFSFKVLGRHQDIARDADEIAALDPQSARHLQLSGAYLLMAASLASEDERLDERERGRIRDELVQRGVQWLRAAIAKGFHAHERFRGEEFAGVSEHPAFVQVLGEMSAAAAKQ